MFINSTSLQALRVGFSTEFQGAFDAVPKLKDRVAKTITFTPTRDLGETVPRLGVDFGYGDVVPFRASIDRKADDHDSMKREMREAMRRNMGITSQAKVPYQPKHEGRMPAWFAA